MNFFEGIFVAVRAMNGIPGFTLSESFPDAADRGSLWICVSDQGPEFSKSSEPKVKGNSDIHKTYGFGMRSDDESETWVLLLFILLL